MVVPYVFPWYLAITQAWVRPVIQIADLTGPLGVSFLLVLCNGALYDAWAAWRGDKRLPMPRLAVAVGILAVALGYGLVRIDQVSRTRAAAPKLKIGVVQANIGIHEKWSPRLAQGQLAVHQERRAAARGQGRRAGRVARVVVPVLLPARPVAGLAAVRRAAGAARLHDAAPVRHAHHRRAGALSVQLGAAARQGQRRARACSTRTSSWCSASTSPTTSSCKFIKQWIPETSNFARGTDVSVFPLQTRRRPRAPGADDLLRGHLSLVRAAAHQARSEHPHQHHQ